MLVSSEASMASAVRPSAGLQTPSSSLASSLVSPNVDPEETRPRNDLAYNSYPHSIVDTRIVIITGALLFVLVSIICMNVAIRWVLRRYAHRLQEEAEARKANTGMAKSQVEALPTRVYNSSKAQGPHAEEDAAASSHCPICLVDFTDEERIRVLPMCQHSFHIGCISTWLFKHSSCPTCRGDLLEAISAEKRFTQVNLHIVITSEGGLSPSL